MVKKAGPGDDRWNRRCLSGGGGDDRGTMLPNFPLNSLLLLNVNWGENWMFYPKNGNADRGCGGQRKVAMGRAGRYWWRDERERPASLGRRSLVCSLGCGLVLV